MANASRILIDDGIALWFDGPEWDDVATEAFEAAADEVKATAQRNAIWEDRTGDARAGLETSVENHNGEVVLTLYHTVEHGLWLEVIQNGRFATIMPTLEQTAPRVFTEAETKISTARAGRN